MEYRDYIADPSIKSFQPGGQVKAGFDMKASSPGMVAGTFCLMRYKTVDGRSCIDDDTTLLFKMKYEDPAYCINVEAADGKEYSAFNFERVYDHWVRLFSLCSKVKELMPYSQNVLRDAMTSNGHPSCQTLLSSQCKRSGVKKTKSGNIKKSEYNSMNVTEWILLERRDRLMILYIPSRHLNQFPSSTLLLDLYTPLLVQTDPTSMDNSSSQYRSLSRR
jgi:hypothetical protein